MPLTAKLPVVVPAAMVTDAGSINAVLSSESATVMPPAGAACDNVTVQVVVPPHPMLVAEHCRAATVIWTMGVIVTLVVFELPFSAAVTVTA